MVFPDNIYNVQAKLITLLEWQNDDHQDNNYGHIWIASIVIGSGKGAGLDKYLMDVNHV